MNKKVIALSTASLLGVGTLALLAPMVETDFSPANQKNIDVSNFGIKVDDDNNGEGTEPEQQPDPNVEPIESGHVIKNFNQEALFGSPKLEVNGNKYAMVNGYNYQTQQPVGYIFKSNGWFAKLDNPQGMGTNQMYLSAYGHSLDDGKKGFIVSYETSHGRPQAKWLNLDGTWGTLEEDTEVSPYGGQYSNEISWTEGSEEVKGIVVLSYEDAHNVFLEFDGTKGEVEHKFKIKLADTILADPKNIHASPIGNGQYIVFHQSFFSNDPNRGDETYLIDLKNQTHNNMTIQANKQDLNGAQWKGAKLDDVQVTSLNNIEGSTEVGISYFRGSNGNQNGQQSPNSGNTKTFTAIIDTDATTGEIQNKHEWSMSKNGMEAFASQWIPSETEGEGTMFVPHLWFDPSEDDMNVHYKSFTKTATGWTEEKVKGFSRPEGSIKSVPLVFSNKDNPFVISSGPDADPINPRSIGAGETMIEYTTTPEEGTEPPVVNPPPPTVTGTPEDESSSVWMIVGIAVGVTAAVAIAGAGTWYIIRKKKG